MAKIGLKYLVAKGTTSFVVAKAIQADISIDINDTKLYGDDAIAESDKSFKSGKITLGVDDLTNTTQAEFLGHAIDENGEITSAITDISPYVGIGFYRPELVGGVRKYRAIWIPKTQFGEPSDSNKTKGESLEFATTSLEGTIFGDGSGNYKQERTFTNEADAIAYLNDKAGIPVTASAGLSALSMTGTGGTLSPAFGAAIRYYTFGGLTGTSFTITATAANHTIKLYVDGVYYSTLTSGSASGAIAMATVGTKKLTIVAQEDGKQSQTTEIIVVKTA